MHLNQFTRGTVVGPHPDNLPYLRLMQQCRADRLPLTRVVPAPDPLPLSSLECPGQTPLPFLFLPVSRLLCLAALSLRHFPFSPLNSFRRARLRVAGLLYCRTSAVVPVVAIHLTSLEPSSSEQHAPHELCEDCCVDLVIEDARTRQPHPERRHSPLHAGHLQAAATGAHPHRVHYLIELPLPRRAKRFLLQTTTSHRSAPPPSPRRAGSSPHPRLPAMCTRSQNSRSRRTEFKSKTSPT
jgi:hypothetical protein